MSVKEWIVMVVVPLPVLALIFYLVRQHPLSLVAAGVLAVWYIRFPLGALLRPPRAYREDPHATD